MFLFIFSPAFTLPAPAQTPPPTPPPTFYVDDDFDPSTPGWGIDHFAEIQAAVNKSPQSTIVVFPGMYHEHLFIGDQNNGKEISIHLVSRSGPSNTVIDGDQTGSTVTFYNAGPGCSIEGFTIMNGTGTDDGGTLCGGGIYCIQTSPLIKNNLIRNNTADFGGGAYVEPDPSLPPPTQACSPIIESNEIHDNTATYSGGGICCYEIQDRATLRNNQVHNNISGTHGGGIYIRGNSNAAGKIIALVEENSVYDNHTGSSGSGAGIALERNGVNKLVHNHVYWNTSGQHGGGIWLGMKEAGNDDRDILDRNHVWGNTAQIDGGGIYIDRNSALLTNNPLRGNEATHGKGGGLFIEGPDAGKSGTQVTNDSLHQNEAKDTQNGDGGGIFVSNGSNVRIENTIVYGNTMHNPNGANEVAYSGSPPLVTYSDVEDPNNPGNPWPDPNNNSNIYVDPLFKDGELHIQDNSPCKDKGNNAANGIPGSLPEIPAWDYDGEPRIYNSYIVDMGSDEVQA